MAYLAGRGRAGLARLLVTVFLVLAGAQVVAPPPAQAQTYAFSRIEIEGNHAIGAATILAYLELERGKPVTAAELNDAYQRLVRSGLFARVDMAPRGTTLVVKVEERPIINRISIEGNKRIKDEALLAVIKSAPVRAYSPAQAEADARAIAKLYAAEGRLGATVDAVVIRRPNNRVDLVFEVQEAGDVEVERLSFVGNRSFSDARLRRTLGTRQAGIFRAIVRGDTFIEDRIAFDRQALTDFYRSRGFVDFQVVSVSTELARDRGGYAITFHVREGQRYRFGKVTATTTVPGVDADAFLAQSRIRTGSVYNPAIVDNAILRMERLANDQELDFIAIEPVVHRNKRDLTLDIEFRITRAPRVFVERIDIEGNQTTLDRVIRAQFKTVEGDPFNPREIRAAAERIRALGFFSNVDVTSRQGSSPETLVIDVNVEETPTGSFAFGASYSTSLGLGLNVTFSEANFLGRGQYLKLAFTTGAGAGTFDFAFAEPNLLGRDLRLTLDAYYTRTQATTNVQYDTAKAHFGAGLEFATSELGRLNLGPFVDVSSVYNVSAGSSAVLVAEAARGRQAGVGAGLKYDFDTRRNGLFDNKGVKGDLDFRLGGFGSDYTYARATGQLAAQTKVLNDELTLRATVAGGGLLSLNGAASRVTDRFFLGPEQLRGFAFHGVGPRDLTAANQDALGGNMFAVARLEAEFPLGLPEEYGIAGGVFLDAGSLWGLDNTLGGTIDDAPHLRSTVGASLFWNTPVGPLRFNYSYAIAKESYDIENRFEITISTKF